MLGHKLYQVLAPLFDVTGTIRGDYSNITRYGFYQESNILTDVDAQNTSRIETTIERISPDVVINCIGIIKSGKGAQDRLVNIWINSLFPHQLYEICKIKGIRLIHISTDCVFSGTKGNYREDDPSDAEDIYGKTKYLGEVNQKNALTIRTSLIGRELFTTNGLVEWFLSNQGSKVNGYVNAIFSGFTTVRFARIITSIIAEEKNLSGVYHVSAEPVSKFKLLTLIRDMMGLNIEIEEYTAYNCDRSLNSTLYRNKTGFKPPSWEEMIDEFIRDTRQYQLWRTE